MMAMPATASARDLKPNTTVPILALSSLNANTRDRYGDVLSAARTAMVLVPRQTTNERSSPVAIGDYLRIFRRFWWVVVLFTALGAGIGYATSLLYTPQYESTARLFVTTQSGTSVGDAYQNNLFSQERVVSYAGLATSQQVAARAVDQLKVPMSADELRSKITATPMPKTVLLDITARDTDPAAAQPYANAVADQLVQVASELETSRRGGTPAAGAVLVDDANYPTESAGLSLLLRVGLGVAGGLAIGLTLAVLAGVLDPKMRRRERVEAVAGSLALGSLVADRRRAGELIDLDAGGIAVERLRELRTNLQFAKTADGRRPHVIAVTSPTPADGRSTTAADLAATFAETGRSVVLVDGDLLNPSLAQRLPLADDQRARAAERGLSTVLVGDHGLGEALIDNVGGDSWAFLPAGPVPSVRRQLWADDSAVGVLDTLRSNFDYVIIDTPALTSCTDGSLAAALGDGAIVLARIAHTKTAALRRALEILRTAHAEVIGAVVTCEPGHRGELSRHHKQVERSHNAGSGESAEPSATTSQAEAMRPDPPAVDQTDPATEVVATQGSQVGAGRSNGVHRVARTQPESR
jgi:capsular exopolysaccharide synthesis family protein